MGPISRCPGGVRRERVGRSERVVWMHRHSGCQVARGKPRYSAGNSAPCAGMISGGGMGAPAGLQGEGTHVCTELIHTVVGQRVTQHCKQLCSNNSKINANKSPL